MKNPIIVIALLASTLAGVQAQVTGTGATATAKQPALPTANGLQRGRTGSQPSRLGADGL